MFLLPLRPHLWNWVLIQDPKDSLPLLNLPHLLLLRDLNLLPVRIMLCDNHMINHTQYYMYVILSIAPSTQTGSQSLPSPGPTSPSSKITSRQGICEACQQPIRYCDSMIYHFSIFFIIEVPILLLWIKCGILSISFVIVVRTHLLEGHLSSKRIKSFAMIAMKSRWHKYALCVEDQLWGYVVIMMSCHVTKYKLCSPWWMLLTDIFINIVSNAHVVQLASRLKMASTWKMAISSVLYVK